MYHHVPQSPNVGALIITIGFGGSLLSLYYNILQKPILTTKAPLLLFVEASYSNYKGPYATLCQGILNPKP